MSINLQAHFCVFPNTSGDSLVSIVSFFRTFCNNYRGLRYVDQDVDSILKLDSEIHYVFFFGQLTGSWKKHGVYCHRDRRTYHPVFVSRQKFPLFTVNFGKRRY